MPKKIKPQPELQKNFFDISINLNYYNDLIKTREAFKIANRAHSGFSSSIEKYNKFIIEHSKKVLENIASLPPLN